MAKSLKISRRVMYEDFAGAVMDLIKTEKLWNQYLAPERDLAEAFGVSRETVRKGLSMLEQQGMISRQQGRGTLVLPKARTRRSKMEAKIIVGSFSQGGGGGDYGAELMAGVTESAGQQDWLLSFSNLAVPTIRKKFLNQLRRKAVDGVVIVSVSDQKLVQEVLRAWRGPMALVDHYFEDLPVTGVTDDAETAARLVTEHLLDLGHRRIGFVDISRREGNPWRYSGYVTALEGAGIKVEKRLVVPCFSSFEAGMRAGEKLLSLPEPPTAILSFDSIRAWGVWRAAEDRDLEVGKDIALATFGHTGSPSGFPDELTSALFDAREVGRAAMKHLKMQMDGRAEQGEWVKVPCELVVRNSSEGARLKK